MLKTERFYTCPGDPIRPVYSAKFKENGEYEVVETGKENFQEFIQSFADEGNIGNMIIRLVNGDASVLSPRSPIYGDFTQFPKTYAEMLQLMIDSRNYFDTLPSETREKFDNDFNKFFASIENPDFLERLGYVAGDLVEDVKEGDSVES